MLGYANVPGIISVVGAKSLGCSWLFSHLGKEGQKTSGYPKANIDLIKTMVLKKKIKGMRYVYVLYNRAIPKKMEAFFEKLLIPTSALKSVYLGAMSERSKYYPTFLVGPFEINADAME